MADSREITVKFPNLFVGFLAPEPTLNANYPAVREASEDSILRSRNLTARQTQAIIECNFPYFAAVMVRSANAKLLRIICDWGNWIFPFDDLFDNGDVRNDVARAMKVMDALEATFTEGSKSVRSQQEDCKHIKPLLDIAHMHESIFSAIRAHASAGICHRYISSMVDYCDGTMAQVQQVQTAHGTSFECILGQRRQSVCVAPLFALVELGHHIRLPDSAFDDHRLQSVQRLGIDITLLHNDLLSYRKEEKEGVPHNVITACRRQGMSAQAAMDFVGSKVSDRIAEFECIADELERSGSEWSDELMRYIQGIRDVIKANLHWSFYSERFLSSEEKSTLLAEGTLQVSRECVALQ